MSDLAFTIAGAGVDAYAASPAIALRAVATERSGTHIDAIALRCQIQLDVRHRRYLPAESSLLEELFGDPSRYADTLRPMTWTHVSATVPAFEGSVEFALPVACSYDFDVAAHKYLASLQEGEIPLNVMFAGTVFVRGASGVMAERVPWSCEARYALPVALWRRAMDAFFPNSAWIRMHRDTFDELRRFKIASGLPTWDAALERLCDLARARS